MVGVERFGNKIVCAALHRGHGIFDRSVRGHHNDRSVIVDLFDVRQQFQAVDIRHLEIGEDQIVGFITYQVERFPTIFGGVHAVPFFREGLHEHVPHRVFVVDHQNSRHLFLLVVFAIPGR